MSKDVKATEPKASAIMDKINQLESDNAQMRSLVEKQHTQLITAGLQATQPAVETPTAAPTKFKDAGAFMEHMETNIMDKVQVAMQSNTDQILKSILPLVKSATPDATVWQTSKMAEKITNEDPGISTENAMKLAKFEQAEETIAATARQAEADRLEIDELAKQASVGGSESSTSSNFSPAGQSKSLKQAMQSNWEAANMDEATSALDADIDIWQAPSVKGVQVVHEYLKDNYYGSS